MKQLTHPIALFLSLIFVFYLPLSFAAWSFNPLEWSHFERFVIGCVVWIGLLVVVLKRFAPKPILTVE